MKYPNRRHKTCQACKVEFCDLTSNNVRLFCTKKCSLVSTYEKSRVSSKKNCLVCNSEFWNKNRHERRRKYCSERCRQDIRFMREHKLSSFEFKKLMSLKKCSICKRNLERSDCFIDHNHSSGKVRGILCKKCNLGLGYFDDSCQFLISAVKYLENSNG